MFHKNVVARYHLSTHLSLIKGQGGGVHHGSATIPALVNARLQGKIVD